MGAGEREREGAGEGEGEGESGRKRKILSKRSKERRGEDEVGAVFAHSFKKSRARTRIESLPKASSPLSCSCFSLHLPSALSDPLCRGGVWRFPGFRGGRERERARVTTTSTTTTTKEKPRHQSLFLPCSTHPPRTRPNDSPAPRSRLREAPGHRSRASGSLERSRTARKLGARGL